MRPVSFVFAVALTLAACAGSYTSRVALPSGGSAAAIARWSISDAIAAPDGRVVVAAHYANHRGDSHEWMPRQTGDIVAALDSSGGISWLLGAPSRNEHPHRLTITPDGVVWILARTVGPFVDLRSEKLAATRDDVILVRATGDGRVQRTIALRSLGITEDVYPVYVAPAHDNTVVAVLGGRTQIIVARIAADGTARFVRRLERGADMPLAPTLRVVGTHHGDRIWLAGAGTSLHVVTGQELAVEAKAKAPDGTYHGPMVLELAMTSGEPRVFPLEPVVVPGGWRYPNGIAFVGGRIVLGRKVGARGSLITVHEPAGLAVEREIYRADHVEITRIAADGDDHVLVTAGQNDHATVRYGDRAVSTSTAPPTTQAVVAFRLPVFASGAPKLVTAALVRSAHTDVGGSLGAAYSVVTARGVTTVGTFWGVLRIDDHATLMGTHGTEDLCTHEDYVRVEDCDRVFWEDASAFVIHTRR